MLEFLGAKLGGEALFDVAQHLEGCSACRDVVGVAALLSGNAPPPGTTLSAGSAAGMVNAPLVLAALRTASDGDYRIERELARGGMGRILVAVDRQGRRVALKVLLSGGAITTRRFVREMQVTAHLQHPSIITLHDAGRFGSGEPFFTMQLVEGRSLRDELLARPPGRERLALLPRIQAAADAIAYAHERGVVHRDIKPGNILLGRFGETVVIDWGLAALQGSVAEAVPAIESGEYPPLEALTAAGVAVGTPAYMAPEQARGDPVDCRADVYGLGAVLYHLLAGAAPHGGSTPREIVERLLAGAPAPLTAETRAVAPELAAIIDKSMARAPSERYASARELAADLERFTAGRLVSAHSYTTASLIRRWYAQHRASVWVGAALCAVLIATAAFAYVEVLTERDRAERMGELAARHRDGAEQLIDYLIVEFRARVAAADRLDLLVGIGAEVLSYYERTQQAQEDADPAVLERRANALGVLAGVEQDKHHAPAAIDLYRRAIELRSRAAEMRPPPATSLVEWSRALNNIGVIEVDRGHADAALDLYREAIAVAERAVSIAPELTAARLRAIRTLERIAEVHYVRKGDVEGAVVSQLRARDQLVALLASNPGDAEVLMRSAEVSGQLALLQRELGRLTEAREDVAASIQTYRRALEQQPDNGIWKRGQALAYLRLAIVEHARRRLPEALAALAEHFTRYEPLAAADLSNEATTQDLAWSRVEACELERHAARLGEAAVNCASAVAVGERHAQQDPASTGARNLLLNALLRLGELQALEGEHVRARASYVRALEIARGLAKEDPTLPRWQFCVAESLQHLARIDLRADAGEARALAAEGLGLAMALSGAAPNDARDHDLVVQLQIILADADAASPEPAKAVARRRAVLEELEMLERRFPEWVAFQTARANLQLELVRSPGAVPAADAPPLRERALSSLEQLRQRHALFAEEEPAPATLEASR